MRWLEFKSCTMRIMAHFRRISCSTECWAGALTLLADRRWFGGQNTIWVITFTRIMTTIPIPFLGGPSFDSIQQQGTDGKSRFLFFWDSFLCWKCEKKGGISISTFMFGSCMQWWLDVGISTTFLWWQSFLRSSTLPLLHMNGRRFGLSWFLQLFFFLFLCVEVLIGCSSRSLFHYCILLSLHTTSVSLRQLAFIFWTRLFRRIGLLFSLHPHTLVRMQSFLKILLIWQRLVIGQLYR